MLNIALIGGGAIGRVHARNLSNHPKARLLYVCDTKEDVARSIASQYSAQPVFNHEETLDKDVDGVIIAASTSTHGDIATSCIAAGKPFLCEKPLASNLSTAEEIVTQADAATLIAGMAFNRRFHPQYSGIKEAVAAGRIGRLESILITSRTASPPTVEFIKTSGGLFGEKGSHFYDLVRWITGEHPIEMFAMGSALVNPSFADVGEVDTAILTMRLPSGTLCMLDFSWRAAYGQDERLEVNGSLGMLQTKQEPVGPFLHYGSTGLRQAGPMPTWYERFEQTYVMELDVFLQAIENGHPGQLPALKDGLAAQQLADAAQQSVRSRMPVTIDQVH